MKSSNKYVQTHIWTENTITATKILKNYNYNSVNNYDECIQYILKMATSKQKQQDNAELTSVHQTSLQEHLLQKVEIQVVRLNSFGVKVRKLQYN